MNIMNRLYQDRWGGSGTPLKETSKELLIETSFAPGLLDVRRSNQ